MKGVSWVPGWPGLAWGTGAALGLVLLVMVFGFRDWPRQGGGPPVAVTLHAFRGVEEAGGSRAPVSRPLVLQADLSGLPPLATCDLEVVDAQGNPVQRSRLRPENGRLAMLVPGGLSEGRYWIRLYTLTPGSRLLREYGLRVE